MNYLSRTYFGANDTHRYFAEALEFFYGAGGAMLSEAEMATSMKNRLELYVMYSLLGVVRCTIGVQNRDFSTYFLCIT